MTETTTDPEYAVVNGWLCEVVNEHTCGTGRDGHYGAHEPGCGLVPVARVADLLAAEAKVKRVKTLHEAWVTEGWDYIEGAIYDLGVALDECSCGCNVIAAPTTRRETEPETDQPKEMP